MNVLLIVSCSILFGAADIMRMIDAAAPDATLVALRYAGIACGLLMLGLITGLKFGFTFRSRFGSPLLAWLLFGLATIASSLANGEIESALQASWMIIGAPLVYFFILPTVIEDASAALIAWALILGDIPFIALSLVNYPLKFPYQGITVNPNCIGILSVTVGAAFLTLLLKPGGTGQTFYRIAFTVGVVGSFGMVLFSGSRTSIVAFIASFAVWLVVTIGHEGHLLKRAVPVLVTFALIAIPIWMAFGEDVSILINGILAKKVNSHQSFLSERDSIWWTTLAQPTVLGHGSGYFEDSFGFGAHNSIIEVYGRYGVVPAFLFIVFGVCGMRSAWRYFKLNSPHNDLAGGPLIIMTCFWVVSFGEAMFGIFAGSINMAFLMCTGVTQANLSLQPCEAEAMDGATSDTSTMDLQGAAG